MTRKKKPIQGPDPERVLPRKAESPADERDETGGGASFPIVGVGASAGGLEAFTHLLKALPADTGMAFVLVQHLAPSPVPAPWWRSSPELQPCR